MDTYETAYDTFNNQGGTYSIYAGRITKVDPDSVVHGDWAWCVAYKPHAPASNAVYVVSSVVEIQEALWSFLTHNHNGDSLFGMWIDKGKLYIDHVTLESEKAARAIGIQHGEKAIYNLKTKETVTL